MKTHTSGCMILLLTAGIVVAPAIHAADKQILEQALRGWSGDTQQSIESSGAGALQQMTRDAIQLRQPQLRMRVRLSDEMPAALKEQLTEGAADKVTDTGLLPQSRIQDKGNKLG